MAGIFSGSHLARKIYGQAAAGNIVSDSVPLLANQFAIRVNFDPIAERYIKDILDIDLTDGTTTIKSVDMPSFSIDTTVVNEYNRKRISQTTATPEPVTLVFNDVANGASFNLWQAYYKYYFLDANELTDVSLSTLSSLPWEQNMNLNSFMPDSAVGSYADEGTNVIMGKRFGYSNPNLKYLIKDIEIFQLHGGRYNKTVLNNPRISAFNHATLSYDDNSIVELTYKIEYEWVEYQYNLSSIEAADLTSFLSKSDVLDYNVYAKEEISTHVSYTGEVPPVPPVQNPQVSVEDVSATEDEIYSSTGTSSIASYVDVQTDVISSQQVNPTPAQNFSVKPRSNSDTDMYTGRDIV